MPVKIRFMDGVKTPSAADVQKWVRAAKANFPDNEPTRRLLAKFLAEWEQTYGFLQAPMFLSHLKMFVAQVELFAAVRDLGNRIVKDFPASQTLYVGLGRSPAPLIAYLQSERYRAFTIPLSDFRPRDKQASITDDALSRPTFNKPIPNTRITAAQQNNLFAHFDKFFKSLAGRHRVLLIDYTISAQSLVAAQDQMQAYFASRELDVEVHALAICSDIDEGAVRRVEQVIGGPRNLFFHPIDWLFYTNARKAWADRWHVMTVHSYEGDSYRESLLARAFKDQKFDEFAEYGSFKILGGDAAFTRHMDVPDEAAYAVLLKTLDDVKVFAS